MAQLRIDITWGGNLMAWLVQPEGESGTGESSTPVALGSLGAGDDGVVRHLIGTDEAILRLMEKCLIPGPVVEVSGSTIPASLLTTRGPG